MSVLDKLHRNDLSREDRPEAELKKLFKGKGKSRDQEQQEDEAEDGSALGRLARVALGKAADGVGDGVEKLQGKVDDVQQQVQGTVDGVQDTVDGAQTTARKKFPGKGEKIHNGIDKAQAKVDEGVAWGQDKVDEGQIAVQSGVDKVLDPIKTPKTTQPQEEATQETEREAQQTPEKKKKKGLFGALAKLGIKPELNVGGFEIGIDDERISVDGKAGNVDVSGEQEYGKGKKLGRDANISAQGNVGGADVNVNVRGTDEGVAGDIAAKGNVRGVDVGVHAAGDPQTGITGKVEADGKVGPADVHAEQEFGRDKRLGRDASIEAKAEVLGFPVKGGIDGKDIFKSETTDDRDALAKQVLDGGMEVGANAEVAADGKPDAATPAERMAKVAVDNAEREAGGKEGGKEAAKDGGKDGGKEGVKESAGKDEVGAPGAAPGSGKGSKGAPTKAADVQMQVADKVAEVPVVAKANPKLGPGGKSIATATSRAPKNAVGRWGQNLDSLDIGPDPDAPIALNAPADPEESGANPVEVGVAGPTLPKLAPKGPRPKITAKKGHGDWHAKQSKGVQSATKSIEARKDAASDHGDALAQGSGTMAKGHVDQDKQAASGLTAVANRPPSLVQKRGGKKPAKKAAPKKTPHELAQQSSEKKAAPPPQQQAKVANDPETIAEQLDEVVETAKAAVPDALAPFSDMFSKAMDPAGGLVGSEVVKKLVDPKTRALAAVNGVPSEDKSNVLGRLDAVAAVGTEKAQQFVDHMQKSAQGAADDRSSEATEVGRDGGAKHGPEGLIDAGISALSERGLVADSYVQQHTHDNRALRRIQEQAFAEIAVSPEETRLQPGPDLRDPLVREEIANGREPGQTNYSNEQVPRPQNPAMLQPGQQPQQPEQPAQPAQGRKDPQQVAANAQRQAQGVQQGHQAKTQQHAQHARNREQEAKQRADVRKQRSEQDKQAREAQLEKEAPAQKEKMKAELTSHRDLAIQVLSMTKEQLAVEYERRLSEDVTALKGEVAKAKTDVAESWKAQEPKAREANVTAKADINKFCDAEKTTIDDQLAKLSRQLKTNPEQAAKTAEEQGKDDCDRYGDTRDGNIERIRASAKDAADEQRRLGAEAYNIGMAKAERQTDETLKETAKKDAQAQKQHFEAQAQKQITEGETKAAAEKKKYDDLIAKRTESYKTTAKNIREKGIGYLDELKTSFEQAKKDIETLRAASIKQADDQLTQDINFINLEITQEMKRLDLRLEDREAALRLEIKYALNSMANLTEDKKAEMRAEVEKAHKEACDRIEAAKANELNAMQLQLADCHARIDQTLAALGPRTVSAVRQLSSFRQEFSDQVTSTVGGINQRAEGAVRAQQQIAQTTETTAKKIRSGAMDSVAGQSAEDLGKRDQWSDFNAQQEAFKKQQEADTKRAKDRENELLMIGNANRSMATEQKLNGSRRQMMEAIGGYGVNPDMGKVMQEMAKLSPEEIEKLFQGPEGAALKARFDELSKPGWIMGPTIAPSDMKRMQEMAKAGTPEEVKAQVIDWCFNGGFTGIGYDDTTFKEVMKGMSPEQRAQVDKDFKAKTGKSISEEIDDEAWFSNQNNRLMNAHAKSDGAAIAEEKWQAAEGGFFRGVKDVVDSVPGGRFLTDPGGELMRGVGPMFGFKVPDHPLDTLAGYGTNQDAYIKQTDRIRELTEPPPGASPAEVSTYLQKRRELMREIDGWLGSNHQGLTLEQMDNSEANSDYNRFWMKNNDTTTFRNMLDAGRTGDWAKYSNNKAAYGAETTLGNRAWLKQEIEYREGRGDLQGLRDFLGTRSEDGKFETFIDENIPQAVDRGYFKSIAENPPPAKGSQKWKEQMANRLLYAQFGGRTGWGDDREELEKVIRGLSKEELDAVRGEYSKLSSTYGLTMDNDANKAQMAMNPVGFFFLGNWSSGNLDSDMYLSYGGYMSDATGGVIGKGRDYAMLEYDLKHGKPETPEDLKKREQFKRDFDTSTGMFNYLRENGIYDSRGAAGQFADAEYDKMMASYDRLKAAGLADFKLDDPRILALAPDQLREIALFQYQIGESEAWAKTANANTRAMVDGIVTVVTTTVTIITTAAITILTAGTATPFLVAALMAAGGAAMAGLAGMGVKVVMLGGAYGGNEAKMDFANLIIDSLVAGVTAGQGISNFAGKIIGKLGISQKLAQEVLSELITNAINAGADLTKFLMDETLYQGSPEEVLAKIRKKSLQVGAGAVLSTGAGVTKYNGAWLQTTIQSAVNYDPSQPAWGQFLNYANSMASAAGSEAATKWGTSVSQNRWGEGGMFGPNKGANDGGDGGGGGSDTGGGGMSGGNQEANLPSDGMRTRSDGTIEVSSPDIASSLANEAAAGRATRISDSPPTYRIETPNGPMHAVVVDGAQSNKPANVDDSVAKRDQPPATDESPKSTKPDPANVADDASPARVNTDDPAAANENGPPRDLNRPGTDPAVDAHNAAVEREMGRILAEKNQQLSREHEVALREAIADFVAKGETPEVAAEKAIIKVGDAPYELNPAQVKRAEELARLKVVNDEIEAGLEGKDLVEFQEKRQKIERDADDMLPEDIRNLADRHEADIKAKRDELAPDTEAGENLVDLRRRVVDDEMKTGLPAQSADEVARDLVKAGMLTGIEKLAGKDLAQVVKLIDKQAKNGQITHQEMGEATITIANELVKRGLDLLSVLKGDPQAAKGLKEALDQIVAAAKQGRPDLVYKLGEFVNGVVDKVAAKVAPNEPGFMEGLPLVSDEPIVLDEKRAAKDEKRRADDQNLAKDLEAARIREDGLAFLERNAEGAEGDELARPLDEARQRREQLQEKQRRIGAADDKIKLAEYELELAEITNDQRHIGEAQARVDAARAQRDHLMELPADYFEPEQSAPPPQQRLRVDEAGVDPNTPKNDGDGESRVRIAEEAEAPRLRIADDEAALREQALLEQAEAEGAETSQTKRLAQPLEVNNGPMSDRPIESSGDKPPPKLDNEFKGVKPGEVPPNLSPEQKALFDQANAEYKRIAADSFQGESFARLQWERILSDAGIGVDTLAKRVDTQDRADANDKATNRDDKRPQHKPEHTLDGDASITKRSSTQENLRRDEVHRAMGPLVGQLKGVEGAYVVGRDPMVLHVKVPDADGRLVDIAIKILQPDHVEGGGLAGLMLDHNDAKIWLSNRAPSDQIERVLAGAIQQAIAAKQGGDVTHAGQVGQLDGMMAKLSLVGDLGVSARTDDPKEIMRVQAERSRVEHSSRMQAEIDLQLARMGLDLPGADRDAALAKLPPKLATEVKAYLDQRQSGIGFDQGQVGKTTQVDGPKQGTEGGSSVLAKHEGDVRPYNEADRTKVLELKLVMEQIAECDARLAERDVKGTSGFHHDDGQAQAAKIAPGESMRRRELMERQRLLLAELQLSGTDSAYYKQRIAELDRLFPGASDAIQPTIENRLAKHEQAKQAKAEAKAAKEAQVEHAKQIATDLENAPDPWLGGRVVIGDGSAGLSNLASLGLHKGDSGFLDPKECLVLGGPDLIERMANSDENMRWGQRAGVFDNEGDAHAIFKGEDGKGTGELNRRNEDGGDFVSVGELSDAMDLARERIGVARVGAKVLKVELQEQHAGAWPDAAKGHNARVLVEINGKQKFLYVNNVDVTAGLGQAMAPDASVMSTKDRDTLGKSKVLVGGEQMMTGMNVEGKKVLVMGYGPTGGWASHEAQTRGAKSVDWTGTYNGEGDNARQVSKLKNVDRVAEAFDNQNINISTDRVLKIAPEGEGAKVTFVRDGVNGPELYDVYYDHIMMASKPFNDNSKPTVGDDSLPNAGTMLEGIQMGLDANPMSPTLQSKGGDGAVRVLGAATADGVNLSSDDRKELGTRAKTVKATADSPDNRVMEAAGGAAELANESVRAKNEAEWQKRQAAKEQLSQSADNMRSTFGPELAGKDNLVGPADSSKPVLPHRDEDALIGLPVNAIPARSSGDDAISRLQAEGLPRWELLTENERGHETKFLNELEQPGALEDAVERFTKLSTDENGVFKFEVDAAKRLYSEYGSGEKAATDQETLVRATANHALHPAAVAVTRAAFLKALDQVMALDPSDPRRNIFVTNGGCAAGKGSMMDMVKAQNGDKFPFGVMWDAAGEGDAQENGWILEAAKHRGLKVTFGFVENDPMYTYNAVLNRALGSGRIVDPITFARSYVRGQDNMKSFLDSDAFVGELAGGSVDTIGVNAGKFNTETKNYPDAQKLGDNGRITSSDLSSGPSEEQVTKAAIEIFHKWLEEKRAKGLPVDHWIEGGIVNTGKFDPSAKKKDEG